jgi:hypothetical protein
MCKVKQSKYPKLGIQTGLLLVISSGGSGAYLAKTESSQKIQIVEYMICLSCADICGGHNFQMSKIEEPQITGGNDRNPSGRKELICSGYGRFLAR